MKRIFDLMIKRIDTVVKNYRKEFQILEKGNPKEAQMFKEGSASADAVVKNNPKQFQILKEVQISKGGSASADPKSNLGGCPRLSWDEKGGEISQISMVYRHLHFEGWAIKLHYDNEVVECCKIILKYLKDGEEDVEAFSRTVNILVENANVIYALLRKDLWIANNVRGCSITSSDAHKGSVHHQLSEIKRDWFVREAIEQGENSIFFKESLKDYNTEIIVRNAMSILIPYCLPRTYMTTRGIMRNRYLEDGLQD